MYQSVEHEYVISKALQHTASKIFPDPRLVGGVVGISYPPNLPVCYDSVVISPPKFLASPVPALLA